MTEESRSLEFRLKNIEKKQKNISLKNRPTWIDE